MSNYSGERSTGTIFSALPLMFINPDQWSAWFNSPWIKIGSLIFIIVLMALFFLKRTGKMKQQIKSQEKKAIELNQAIINLGNERDEIQLQLEDQHLLLEKTKLELRRLKQIDGITDIPDYKKFIELYDQEWRRAFRYSRELSIVLMNVDFMDLFNNTYGRQAGDECLKKIAKMLAEIIKRPGDLVAKYKDDEFIVILSETSSKDAFAIAEMLRVGAEFLKIDNEKSSIAPHITISIGIASIIPKESMEPGQLIEAANRSLAQSKEDGKNRITIADDKIKESIFEKK